MKLNLHKTSQAPCLRSQLCTLTRISMFLCSQFSPRTANTNTDLYSVNASLEQVRLTQVMAAAVDKKEELPLANKVIFHLFVGLTD